MEPKNLPEEDSSEFDGLGRDEILATIERFLDEQRFIEARLAALRCFERGYLLGKSHVMLLSTAIFAGLDVDQPHYRSESDLAGLLWHKATSLLPRRYHEDAVNHAVRLARIYLARDEYDHAMNCLLQSRRFALLNGATRLSHNLAVREYDALAPQPSRTLFV